MKKILLFTIALASLTLNSQTLSYVDQAVLFSTGENYGTARYTGMGGAFGAIGGDISAVDINPAGLAVFNNTSFSTSMSYRDTKMNTSFYGNNISTKDDYFRFSQIGGVLGVNTIGNSGFKKFSFGFNYNIIKDYNNNFLVNGNSGIPTYVDDPFLNFDGNDYNNVYYTNVDDRSVVSSAIPGNPIPENISGYANGFVDGFIGFKLGLVNQPALNVKEYMAYKHKTFSMTSYTRIWYPGSYDRSIYVKKSG